MIQKSLISIYLHSFQFRFTLKLKLNKFMPNDLEAKARIKINKLLEESGWRFFDTIDGKANIHLESHIKFDDLGEDFEKTKGGFIDFLLLDEFQNPLVVLEAKSEKIEPLFAKEQARKYALAQKAEGHWFEFSSPHTESQRVTLLNQCNPFFHLHKKYM